jgi:hypothetical protein
VKLFLKGKPIIAAMIVTNDVAQSIIGMNIIGPKRLVMDPIRFQNSATYCLLCSWIIGKQTPRTVGELRKNVRT